MLTGLLILNKAFIFKDVNLGYSENWENFHDSLRECIFPAKIYLLKDNIRNTRKRRQICSKLRIKTPER